MQALYAACLIAFARISLPDLAYVEGAVSGDQFRPYPGPAATPFVAHCIWIGEPLTYRFVDNFQQDL
jgi:hypothetical protein